MKGRLAGVAAVTGGRLAGADAPFGGVSIDTRTIGAGELFVALRGERFDGHDFAAQAAAGGAAGLVVERPLPERLPQVVVADSVAALGTLATDWRAKHRIPVIGIAGSNGKTTTKELLAAALAQAGPVLATRGNLNNHLGVPLTLFGLDAGHRHAVVEMGANHPGEVAALARIARPTIGLVTNAGAEHLEGFGSLAGAARAEGELFAELPPEGVAVVNADDPFAGLWRAMARAGRIVSFGLESVADVRAADLRAGIEGGTFVTEFDLQLAGQQARVRLALAGRHNVLNALGAAAAAHAAGQPIEAIVAGLEATAPVRGRLQLKPGLGGARLIDDSYNANPSSVRAGIDVLCALPGEHWLVLGAMAELGTHAEASHAEVGDYARRAGVARLFAMGEAARHAVASFGARAAWFADAEALAGAVAADLGRGVTVLVKGSRVNRLEQVVERLLPPAAAANGN